MFKTIPPMRGTSLKLRAGEQLVVRSPEARQVSDLYCFSAEDPSEHLSTGRSLDQAERLHLSTGDQLVSNRGRPMLTIRRDDCGRHDLLLPPCRESENGHPGCEENLAAAFREFGIGPDRLGGSLNIFMRVESDQGRLAILPPLNQAGDVVVLEAHMDLLVGLTACAHFATNGGSLKPIEWRVTPPGLAL